MALVKKAAPGRKAVLNRILAGLGGGYMLAAAAASGLSVILSLPRIEAVVAAQLVVAYILYILAALAVFVPRRGVTAWAIVLLPCALFALAGWLGGVR